MPGYSSQWRILTERIRARLTSATCSYCGGDIDLTLHHDHAMSLTFDHIMPRVLGGDDTEENMRPCHRSCNTRRSNDLRRNGYHRIITTIEW